MSRFPTSLTSLALALVLGCGGGTSGGDPVPSDVIESSADSASPSDASLASDTPASPADLVAPVDVPVVVAPDVPHVVDQASAARTRMAVVAPDGLPDVRSPAYWLVQEEHLYADEVYVLRGLLTFLKRHAVESAIPVDEVIVLGEQTTYAERPGPSGQVPLRTDCGRLRWTEEGDVVRLFWHVPGYRMPRETDPSETLHASAYPYLEIELHLASDGSGTVTRTVIAASGDQRFADGAGGCSTIRPAFAYFDFDEATGDALQYFRAPMAGALDEAAGCRALDTEEYVYVRYRPVAEGAPMVLYAERGVVDATRAHDPREAALAVGDDAGAAVRTVLDPRDGFHDDGTPIREQRYTSDVFDAAGRLVARSAARRYEGAPLFDWQPFELAATLDLHALYPDAPPAEVLLRREQSPEGTLLVTLSLDGETWTTAEGAPPGPPLWRQSAEAWRAGDTMYEYRGTRELADGAAGVWGTWQTLPAEETHLGFPFFVEREWPAKALLAADPALVLRLRESGEPGRPYDRCWLDADGNEAIDPGEALFPLQHVALPPLEGDGTTVMVPMLFGFGALPATLAHAEGALVEAREALAAAAEPEIVRPDVAVTFVPRAEAELEALLVAPPPPPPPADVVGGDVVGADVVGADVAPSVPDAAAPDATDED